MGGKDSDSHMKILIKVEDKHAEVIDQRSIRYVGGFRCLGNHHCMTLSGDLLAII